MEEIIKSTCNLQNQQQNEIMPEEGYNMYT